MNNFRADGKIEFRALFPYGNTVPAADHAEGFLRFVNSRERDILPAEAFRNIECVFTDAVLLNAYS